MEIKYKPTYIAANKQYSLGEIPLMLGYAMEIVDLRPELAEGKLKPGELLRIIYGVTPEEFALKDATDSRELAELAAKLRKGMPADRLLGWAVTDLRGVAAKEDIKLKTTPTIDDGAFARRVKEKQAELKAGPVDELLVKCRDLQKLAAAKDAPAGVKEDHQSAKATLGQALLKLDTLYVAYDVLLKERFPSAGFDGRIELFTTPQRAERARAAIQKANADTDLWKIRQLSGGEIDTFFRNCADRGLLFFRVDNGFAAAELQLGDFRTDMPAENAVIRGNMIREIEFGVRFEHFKKVGAPEQNTRGAFESVMTLRNFVWHDLGNALLYALCVTDDASSETLCTQEARAKADPTRKLHVVAGDKCIALNDKNSDKQFVAAFTSEIFAASFSEKIDQNARPVLMTFDDLTKRVGALGGMNIDCETLGYRVLRENFDQIRELRGKPPMIVRVKPKEQADAPAAVNAAPDRSMGDLPDPDKFAPPAKTEETEPKADEKPELPEEEQTETKGGETPPPKKGFFKRLFGKDDK